MRPLRLRDAAAFRPGYSAEATVEVYAVAGGMPVYLRQFSDRHDLWTNLCRVVFNRDSFLHNEPDLLLREELRESRLYAALLRAIAGGYHQVSDITRAAGLTDRATTTRYLDTLRGLGLVEHRWSIGLQRRGRRWGTWHLANP